MDAWPLLQPESCAEGIHPWSKQGLCGETTLEQVCREIAERATFLGAAALKRLEGTEGDGDGESLGSPIRLRTRGLVHRICVDHERPQRLTPSSSLPI